MQQPTANRDIIVVGASAGGVDALRTLVAGLPADLPAAVFVVLHVGEASRLAPLLDGAGPLPGTPAASGEPLELGHVYLVPPRKHPLFPDRQILLPPRP